MVRSHWRHFLTHWWHCLIGRHTDLRHELRKPHYSLEVTVNFVFIEPRHNIFLSLTFCYLSLTTDRTLMWTPVSGVSLCTPTIHPNLLPVTPLLICLKPANIHQCWCEKMITWDILRDEEGSKLSISGRAWEPRTADYWAVLQGRGFHRNCPGCKKLWRV